MAVPQYNPGAVLHLKVGFTQQSHEAVFLVIFFPFLVLMSNCMSTATAWLSNAVNSSTEQEKYTQYAEAIQGAQYCCQHAQGVLRHHSKGGL